MMIFIATLHSQNPEQAMRGDVHSRQTNPEFCGPGRARLCDKQKLQLARQNDSVGLEFRGALWGACPAGQAGKPQFKTRS